MIELEYIRTLIDRGGPSASEYAEVDSWIREFYDAWDDGQLPSDSPARLREVMKRVLSPETMHGWAFCKPYGYAGDFEIIDRHYLQYVCSDPQLANWDRYWHCSPSATAVRNRKTYFHQLLQRHVKARDSGALEVLNIASGPARDVLEFLNGCKANSHFDCVEHDERAILHAQNICAPEASRVTFRHGNALRFRPVKLYNLIWAAGLFDYFSDRTFKFVLGRLLPFVAPGGELVIGNFNLSHSSADLCWMRLYEWELQYRTADHLRTLAVQAGADDAHVRIGKEPSGVNLFLHIGC